MTINELILLAESSGFYDITDMRSKEALGCLEYFASKVAAQAKMEEREQCAKLCETYFKHHPPNYRSVANNCAEVIRKRGEQ